MSNQSQPDEAYFDRNQAAQLAAYFAQDIGMTVGWRVDPDEPDWPVLVIDLPNGQVSWHIPKDEAVAHFEPYPYDWDGHTVEQKRARINEWISVK